LFTDDTFLSLVVVHASSCGSLSDVYFG